MAKKIIMPETQTPNDILPILIAIAGIAGLLLYLFLDIWGILLLLAIVASSTSHYTCDVEPFNAQILVNKMNGGMRIVFPGINFKLPWEDDSEEPIDLRVELSEVCDETYASKTALMFARYVYTIRPDISESIDEDAEDKILKYSYFEHEAIKKKGKALFSMLLSDYYGNHEGKDLLNKKEINKEVFGTEDNPKQAIIDFELKHGVEVAVRLEDSDFNPDTQKYRDMVEAAESFNLAVKKLVDGGMARPQAENIIKLMNLNGVTEKNFNLNVDAPHLKNVRDVTILGAGGITGDDKKKGK